MKKILAVLALSSLMLFSVAGCSKVEQKSEEELQEQQTKYTAYANDEHILSALDAKEMIDAGGNLALIDISDPVDYRLGHAEGFANAWRPDYSAASGVFEFGGMRNTREEMADLLGRLGADKDSTILIMGTKDNHDPYRFFWQIKMYGHDNVKVIDGGIDAWKAAGLPTQLTNPSVTAKTFEFTGPERPEMLADMETVLAAIDDDRYIILDTRSLDEATGATTLSGAARPGRIPNSVWIEFKENLNEDKTFKTAEELRALYEAQGVTSDKIIIPYCQSGVRSAQTTFVLAELLGYENVMNYDGSWIEWSFNEDMPVEMGDL